MISEFTGLSLPMRTMEIRSVEANLVGRLGRAVLRAFGPKALDVHVQPPAKAQGADHRRDEPIDHPRIAAARPRGALRVDDVNALNGRTGVEGRLFWVKQNVRPILTRPLQADAHEPVADG